jgi:WD40-like Beta Propeller Repeat
VPFTAIPLTTYPGREQQPSFAPDGNSVAFSWNGETEDNWDIYVKLIAIRPVTRFVVKHASAAGGKRGVRHPRVQHPAE